MSAPLRVLLVEDDEKVAGTVLLYLRAAGYDAEWADDGREAVARAEVTPFDLVVLDLLLPGLDGHAVCRRLRETSRVPIVMLTARTTEDDRVRGLDLGADDYVAKPFSPRELMARIRAVLRRAAPEAGADPARGGEVLRSGALAIDVAARTVRRDGDGIELTPTQFDLLVALARRPGRVFPRRELADVALGADFSGNDRTVDAHVKNLRRRLEPDPRKPRYVETVFGVGYRFAPFEAERP